MPKFFPSARGLSLSGVILTAVCATSFAQFRPIKVERLQGVRGLAPAGAGDAEAALEVTASEAFVRFSTQTTSTAEMYSRISGMGGEIIGSPGTDGWVLAGLPAGMSVKTGLEVLAGLPGALRVQPNTIYRLNKLPNDPQSLTQYHLNKINAFAAWEFDVGASTDVTIVVVDAGVDFTNPDLVDKNITSPANANRVCSAADCNTVETPGTVACNHGTRVAGVAAAAGDNGKLGTGVSWGAKVLSLRIFDTGSCTTDCGGGACVTNESRIRRAVEHATTLVGTPGINKVVVNMSVGGACDCGRDFDLQTLAPSAGCGGADGVLPTAMANAATAGVILVAAAGNYSNSSSGGPVQSPANCEHVIPVGATDENDNVASFSARGSSLAAHGVVAPGVNILTTDVGGGMATTSGTSFSAPIVAGLAALIYSAKPSISTTSVKAAIQAGAEGIGISSLGFGPAGSSDGAGRVNAFKSMRVALGKGPFEGDEKAIAFPNPFRPSEHGTATFSIPSGLQGKNPSIKVYTMDGQLVRDLAANTTWDGTNLSGRKVASGVFIFTVKTDAGMERGRIAVIR